MAPRSPGLGQRSGSRNGLSTDRSLQMEEPQRHQSGQLQDYPPNDAMTAKSCTASGMSSDKGSLGQGTLCLLAQNQVVEGQRVPAVPTLMLA